MRSILGGGLVLAVAACGSQQFVPPPPSPERVYAMSEVEERPEIILAPALRYPDDPRLAGVDGVVVVRIVIDTAGNPEAATARVVQTPDSTLGVVARAMVLKTLFRPARVRGRVVQVMVDLPVEFSRTSVPPVMVHIAGDVFGMADIQEPPHLTSAPQLTYPAPLLLAGVEGHVLLQAIIDSTGRVEDGSVRVLESSDPRFNQAAKDYIAKARFSPARIGGRPVRARFQIPVDFKLPSRN